MTTPSNVYAEKIFGEHPISLWALDEDISYLSLLSSTTNLVGYSKCSASIATNYPLLDKFSSEDTIEVLLDEPAISGVIDTAELIAYSSEDNSVIYGGLPATALSDQVVIGTYINSVGSTIISYQIGYYTVNEDLSITRSIPKIVSVSQSISDWIFISATLDIPTGTNFYPYLDITYMATAGSTYKVYTKGFSVGHDAEEFMVESLGVRPSEIVVIPGMSGILGIPGFAYGLKESSAYYVINSRGLCAKNTGIPMVYGAQNVTRLFYNNGLPSVVVPTESFLTKDGLSGEYTIEFWLRASTQKNASGRIFGPTGSEDGIYIDKEFIRLKIGNNVGSYYLNNWMRPMLFDIRISGDKASLLINAEEVISIDIASLDISLLSTSMMSAFYVPENVNYIEIDAVAMYSYSVPMILAKRRLAFAQALEAPDGNSKTFGGKLALIDYSVADYTGNYAYPDIGNFQQGSASNIAVNKTSLSAPVYDDPRIVFKSSSLESMITNSSNLDQVLGYSGLSFLKDTCHLKIDKFSLLDSQIAGMYGIFSAQELIVNTGPAQDSIFSYASGHQFETGDKVAITIPNVLGLGEYYIYKIDDYTFSVSDTYSNALAGIASVSLDYSSYTAYSFTYINEQTLILISNKVNGDTFKISIIDGGLRYSSVINSIYTEMLFEAGIAYLPLISVGFSIDNLKEYFGQYVGNFFDNVSQLEVFVGSNQDFSDRFIGQLFKFGLANTQNYEKISSIFQSITNEPYDSGTLELNPANNSAFWSYVLDAGYPDSAYGILTLLSHVATYTFTVKNIFGVLSLDIASDSYWQDSIALSHFAQYVNTANSRYYDVDFIQFNIDYASNHDVSSGYFDTEDSMVKTYISFQYTGAGANTQLSSYANIQKLNSSRVVSPGEEWKNTAYEVVDRTIIYLPKDIDLTMMSLVTHIELKIDGVKANPMTIRRIEYASEAFNDDTANPIGTKYGVDLYPYTRYGSYFDYKAKNPYSIYKRSTPYLYLTDSSGIEILGEQDQYVSRGVLMQVNENAASSYRVKSLQMFAMSKSRKFSLIPEEIFEVSHASGTIKFFIQSWNNSRTRGRLYAVDSSTGMEMNGIAYYINGILCKDPILEIGQWTAIGFSFASPLVFDLTIGAIRLSSNILFNSISYYESSKLEEIERQAFNRWDDVRYYINASGTQDAQIWGRVLSTISGQEYNWGDVLVASSTDYYGADIPSMYGAYIGTNKLVVDDNTEFVIGKSSYSVKNNIEKTSFTIIPV